MRLRYALIVTAALAPIPFLLVPSGSGACEPCYQHENGERWHLVLESWTVDGTSMEVPRTDTGYLIENPYMDLRDGNNQDLFLRAELADPELRGLPLRLVVGREDTP